MSKSVKHSPWANKVLAGLCIGGVGGWEEDEQHSPPKHHQPIKSFLKVRSHTGTPAFKTQKSPSARPAVLTKSIPLTENRRNIRRRVGVKDWFFKRVFLIVGTHFPYSKIDAGDNCPIPIQLCMSYVGLPLRSPIVFS